MVRSFLYAALPLAGALVPAALVAQTPPPTVTPDPACPAVLQVAWDVSTVPGATGSAWELKDAPFTNPDGGDPDRIDSGQVASVTGSVTVDLREHGPVLDGTAYYVRILPRPGASGDPSEAVVHDPLISLDGALQASGGTLDWTLPAGVADCADRVRWEFAAAGGPVLDSGVETGSFASGQATVPTPAPGDYEARIAAFHGGTTADDAVGPPATVPVTIQGAEPIAVTVTVTDVAAAACTAGAPASGVTVTATGGGSPQTATTGGDGTASLSLPAGAWQLVATRSDCGTSAAVQVSGPGGTTSVVLELPGCPQPFDLAVALNLGEIAQTPVDVPVVVTNAGSGPAPAGSVEVLRGEEMDPREVFSLGSTRLEFEGRPVDSESFPALCPGDSRDLNLLDKDVEPGTWVYLARLDGPGGTDARNDEASRTVGVSNLGSVAFSPVFADVDLYLTMTQTASTIVANTQQTYVVTVANDGKGSAGNATLESVISEHLDYVSSSGTGGFSCVRTGLEIRCTGGTIPGNGSATVTIVTALGVTAGAGHDIIFSAGADPDGAIPEISEGNNLITAFATTSAMVPADYAVTEVMQLIDFAADRKYATVRLDVVLARGLAPPAEVVCTQNTTDAGAIPAFSADGGELSVSVECLWGVLVGPSLQPGWEIDSVKVTQTEIEGVTGSCVLESFASDGSGIRLRVIKPAGPAPALFAHTPGRFNTCYINEIVLTGPAGGDWKDAFE